MSIYYDIFFVFSLAISTMCLENYHRKKVGYNKNLIRFVFKHV